MVSSLFRDPVPAAFVDQFERDDDGWRYRYKGTGAAHRITDAEQQAFVAAFEQRRRRLDWSMVAVIVVLTAALIVRPAVDILPAHLNAAWYVVFGGVLRFVTEQIAFRAPLRLIEQSPLVAPALSTAAAARHVLAHKSPTELVGAAFAASGFLFLAGLFGWPLDSNGWLFVAGFLWMASRAIIQAVRERQARGPDLVTSPAT